MDPLLLVPLAGQLAGTPEAALSACGPSFPHPFFTPRHRLGPVLLYECAAFAVFFAMDPLLLSPLDEELSLRDFVSGNFTALRDIGIQGAPQRGGFVFLLVPPTS